MPRYEVYTAIGESRRGMRVYSFDADDDVEAEKFVCERLTDVPVQLWHRSRRIAAFGGDDAG